MGYLHNKVTGLLLGGLLLTGLSACGDTGQTRLSYPIFGVGQVSAEITAGAWQVSLTEAQLAFGPAYFCPTAAASADLCPVAQAEFADVARVDLMDPNPQALGTIEGTSGVINSATYNFGIIWLLTQNEPVSTDATIDGHSARFAGTAVRQSDNTTLDFVVDIDVTPFFQGTNAIQGDRLDTIDIQDSDTQLTVSFDVDSWFRQVDFDEVLAAQSTTPVIIADGTIAHNTILIAMSANRLPTFIWSE